MYGRLLYVRTFLEICSYSSNIGGANVHSDCFGNVLKVVKFSNYMGAEKYYLFCQETCRYENFSYDILIFLLSQKIKIVRLFVW